jgi:flagellar basal body-associated protein FliL
MKMVLDLLKLIVLLAALAGIIYGAWHFMQGSNQTKKYSHPISRPGAGW